MTLKHSELPRKFHAFFRCEAKGAELHESMQLNPTVVQRSDFSVRCFSRPVSQNVYGTGEERGYFDDDAKLELTLDTMGMGTQTQHK